MNIYLIRHGESEQNVNKTGYIKSDRDIPLTANGHCQAKETAKFMSSIISKKEKTVIITSPYLRTRQTSFPIEQELKLKPIYDERLREYERGKFGDYTLEECEKLFPQELENFKKRLKSKDKFFACPPGGESGFDVTCRMKGIKFVLEKLDAFGCDNVIIVSHCGAIKSLLVLLCGYDALWYAQERNMTNGSVRKLVKDGNKYIDEHIIFKGYKNKIETTAEMDSEKDY